MAPPRSAFASDRGSPRQVELVYSVEKLGKVSQRRTNGSREFDSKEISARDWISCNLRERKCALAARSIRAVEFFKRIGQN
jgi:hypothetical protein